MKIIVLIFLIISAYSFHACASGPEHDDNQALPKKTGGKILKLTINDNNREIQANVGETVELVLISQGGTGYEWHTEGLDENMLRIKDNKATYEGDRNKVGGKMVNTWYIEVLKPGDTELRMSYYRVWEGKSKALKHFNVKLHIAAAR